MLRVLNGLSSDNDEARDALRSFAAGDRVSVDINRQREHKTLRWWFALCSIIADNTNIGDKETVSKVLQIKAGHVDIATIPSTGELLQWPAGINYRKVPDEAVMQGIKARAIRYICEELMPTLTEPEIEDEILRLIGYRSER